MPWSKGRGVDPKYRTKQHRDERAKWARLMQQQGWLECAQPTCLHPTRTITAGTAWHLGHADNGIDYIGPVHARCNVSDGARRGRARQDTTHLQW